MTGSLSGAAAQTPATRAAAQELALAKQSQDDCSDTAGVPPYATGLPVLPCAKNPFTGKTLFTDGGAIFDPITQQTPKTKLTLQLTPAVSRVFYILCATNFPPSYPPCPYPVDFPPTDTSVSNGGYYGVFADAWPQSARGVQPQFGLFPPTVVNVMGFGALPVRATVTIKLKLGADGLPIPLRLNWLTSQQFIKPGAVVPGYEQYGPAPAGNFFFAPPAVVSGGVDIVLSDVSVDQVPLDVGTNCHTSTTLSLGALGGFYRSGVQPVPTIPTEDNPNRYQQVGGYQPLFNGKSYLSGTVDIPEFTGCTAGGQDLSPLITGAISSQNNPVDVTQDGSLRTFGCLAFPDEPVIECSAKHPPTTYGP